jgi:hypothetical protein
MGAKAFLGRMWNRWDTYVDARTREAQVNEIQKMAYRIPADVVFNYKAGELRALYSGTDTYPVLSNNWNRLRLYEWPS